MEKRAIEEQLKRLPSGPGVYLMKDSGGAVIYIGKAKNLKTRVRSYFHGHSDTRYAVKFLASRTKDIDCVITANEKEALLLEDTLLKQHKPRYNIRLKDSKTYVSIKITLAERFPRILVTRQIKKDGSRYFGPYVSARAVRETIKLLRRIFPLCVCSPSEFRNRTRPCLDYQLGLCSAPAVGLITEGAYRDLVDGAVMLLEGRNAGLLKRLKRQMTDASKDLDFERAARVRDQISALKGMLEQQTVVSHRRVDRDVFSMARGAETISVHGLFVRDGRVINSVNYSFHDTGLPPAEILSSFLTQFYRGDRFIPPEIIIPRGMEDSALIEEWLGDKAKRKVRLHAPARGGKLKLLKMAEDNALEALKKKTEKAPEERVVEELQRRLRLGNPPRVIEGFDISNIGGAEAVGAMVRFVNAAPDKTGYRLFRIRHVAGPDDYAMMREVMERRYGHASEDELPGLILVDGGKGQLGVAVKVLGELGMAGAVNVAALAKEKPVEDSTLKRPGMERVVRGERVYLPNVKDPILLKEGSRPDLLLRRIRDEVHRFAISYQRRLRTKKGMRSILDTIPGIGEKRRKALYKRFGDIKGITGADLKDLESIPGITKTLAKAIKALSSAL